jgi:hypothetical protein
LEDSGPWRTFILKKIESTEETINSIFRYVESEPVGNLRIPIINANNAINFFEPHNIVSWVEHKFKMKLLMALLYRNMGKGENSL